MLCSPAIICPTILLLLDCQINILWDTICLVRSLQGSILKNLKAFFGELKFTFQALYMPIGTIGNDKKFHEIEYLICWHLAIKRRCFGVMKLTPVRKGIFNLLFTHIWVHFFNFTKLEYLIMLKKSKQHRQITYFGEILYRGRLTSFKKLKKPVWRWEGRQHNKFRSMLFLMFKCVYLVLTCLRE